MLKLPFLSKRKKLKIDFDPSFYKKYYSDLNGFKSDRDLLQHYIRHGQREGRFPNSARMIQSLEAELGMVPKGFDPVQYKLLHHDLSDIQETWALIQHYLLFGRKENRKYYLNTEQLEIEYRELIFSDNFALRFDRNIKLPQSFAAFLEANRIETPNWVSRFKLYEFSILNEHWLPYQPISRMDGIYMFLTQGIERLAPISLKEVFEPNFFRQQVTSPSKNKSDHELYREWLQYGIHNGIKGSENAALQNLLGDSQSPVSFNEKKYRSCLGRDAKSIASGRYNALMHYVEYGFSKYGISVLDRGNAAPLIGRIAQYHHTRGNFDVALSAYDQAIALNPHLSRLHHLRGDCLASTGRNAEATDSYLAACNLPQSDLWSHMNAAQGLADRPSGLEDSIGLLKASAPAYHGSTAWRTAALSILERLFQTVSAEAFDLHREGSSEEADALMVSTLDRIASLIPIFDPLPGRLVRRSTGHVVLIANQDLPQCNWYRVQQRKLQLASAGWTVEIINERDIFLSGPSIDKSSVVIFYRVAASPQLIKAILYARALGVYTVYDIDDLIFDAKFYPEPLETYDGQVSEDEYLGLRFGVPLFRYAISLCDIGLTSTSMLAELVGPLVRSQKCYIIRNGFDQRNNDFLATALKPLSDTSITIFYGSGTKAHGQDFSEIIAPALVEILISNSNVRLALAGYVPLDARFDRFQSRIFRLGFTPEVRVFWEVLSGIDINVAVLSRNPATDAKSEIKWLEAAMFGVPSVVSPTATYQDVLIDGENCIFAETSVDWSLALQKLVSDANLRRQIGERARKKAIENYGLAASVEVLQQIIPSRHASLSPVLSHSALTASSEQNISTIPKFDRERRLKDERRRRILIVNVYFPPHTFGGATRVVRDNVDYYIDHASDRYDIAVLSTDHSSRSYYQSRVDSYRGVPIFRIGTPSEANMDWRPFDDAIAQPVETLIQQFDPDLVHFHCIQRLTGTAVEIVRRLGIPYIISCHDAWWVSDFQFLLDSDGTLQLPSSDPLSSINGREISPLESIARRRRLARLLDGAERVLCVSDSFLKIYQDAGVRNAYSVPNGVPILRNLRVRTPGSRGKVRLGHIGGRTTHKGATLVESVLRQNVFPNLELTLVDHGQMQGEVYQEIWGETKVTIVGFVPQDNVADLYAELDVLLAPSVWPESFGLVAREAIASGLWVVASDRGAIGEGVVDGVNGFIIDVNTQGGLKRIFSEMNDNPMKYATIPPVVAPKTRSVADQCRDMIECYEAILSGY